MDYHNIFARGQLLLVLKALHDEQQRFADDVKGLGDADIEYRRGIRGGLDIAILEIHEHLEQLQSDFKQK